MSFTAKPGWDTDQLKKLDVGMLEIATDIHRRSAILAPVLSGNLVASGRIKRNGAADYSIIYGGNSGFNVPYAKRRHFENRKHPQTIGYLSKAAESVSRGNLSKYFRGL
jgi:hypothetical protein